MKVRCEGEGDNQCYIFLIIYYNFVAQRMLLFFLLSLEQNTTLLSIILNSFVSLSSFLELFLSMLFIGFLFSFCSRNLFLFEMPFGKRCFHTGHGSFPPSITLYPLKTSSFNEPLCQFIDHLSLPSCVCIDVRKPGSLGHESSLHHE